MIGSCFTTLAIIFVSDFLIVKGPDIVVTGALSISKRGEIIALRFMRKCRSLYGVIMKSLLVKGSVFDAIFLLRLFSMRIRSI